MAGQLQMPRSSYYYHEVRLQSPEKHGQVRYAIASSAIIRLTIFSETHHPNRRKATWMRRYP
jgi:hypothetical protein